MVSRFARVNCKAVRLGVEMKRVLTRRMLAGIALGVVFGLIAFFGDKKLPSEALGAALIVGVFLAVLAALTVWPPNLFARMLVMLGVVVFLVARRPRGIGQPHVSIVVDVALNLALVGLCVGLILLGSFLLRLIPGLRTKALSNDI